MKIALMVTAIVLASSAGALAAGASQRQSERGVQQHEHHTNGAGTRSMNRGTSANGGVGTGGVTTGSGRTGDPSNTNLDRSGRPGTSASPGANGLDTH
jgi:hypothetical protein